jgi:hypothetical protein
MIILFSFKDFLIQINMNAEQWIFFILTGVISAACGTAICTFLSRRRRKKNLPENNSAFDESNTNLLGYMREDTGSVHLVL